MLTSNGIQGSATSRQERDGHRYEHRHKDGGQQEQDPYQQHPIALDIQEDRPRQGSNKRKISSKGINSMSNAHQQQFKYIEFQPAFVHTGPSHQDQHGVFMKQTSSDMYSSSKPMSHQTEHHRRDKRFETRIQSVVTSEKSHSQDTKHTGVAGKKDPLLLFHDSEHVRGTDRYRHGDEKALWHQQKIAGDRRGDSSTRDIDSQRHKNTTQETTRQGYPEELSDLSSGRSPSHNNESLVRQRHRYQHPRGNGKSGEILTIRDILDSQELRDQISEFRRSLNSNTEQQPPRTSSSQESDLERFREHKSIPSALSATASASQSHKFMYENTRKPSRGLGVASEREDIGSTMDLSMDKSLLERKFRERLDALIPTSAVSGTGMLTGNHEKHDRSPTATRPASPEKTADRRDMPAGRPRPDLYHSSYSPTEFSDVDDLDDNEDDDEGGEEDQETVELKRFDATDKSNERSPRSSSPTPHISSQVQAMTTTLRTSGANAQPKKPTPNPTRLNKNHRDDKGDDSGEISFEREVALARAKRELGASTNQGQRERGAGHKQNTAATATFSAGRSIDTRLNDRLHISPSPITTVSKLDRGRDLALEDLVSPTRFNFGPPKHPKQQQHHQLDPTAERSLPVSSVTADPGQDWMSAPTFPLLSTAKDLAQLDNATAVEDRFLELAGPLGEGQAVASVLGTLKGMIRQLKSEKKASDKANLKMQKELRKAHHEQERLRKANEKLSRSSHAPLSSNHAKSIRHEEEQGSKNIGAQREKDKIARDMAALQKRIDSLELQRAEMQKREKIRAKEEADLLLLVDSDDDDSEQENEDNESVEYSETEGGESEADAHTTEPYRNDQRSQSDETEPERSILLKHRKNRGAGVKSRSSKKKTLLSSPSKPAGRKLNNDQDVVSASRTRTRSGPKSIRSKSVQYLESESHPVLEKVEEVVHIHHHVYYGDEDQHNDLSPKSRSQPMGNLRISSAGHHHNTPRDVYVEPRDNQHHVRIDAGYGMDDRSRIHSFRQGSTVQGPPVAQPTPFNRDAQFLRNHGVQETDVRYDTVMVDNQHSNPAFSQPSFTATYHNVAGRSEVGQTSIQPRARIVSIQDKGDEHPRSGEGSRGVSITQGTGFHELGIPMTSSVSSKHKKFSINLQRILSLLKIHDPRRCTVCRNGGDAQDHDRHQQEQVRQSLSSLRIDGKPVRVRQRRAENTATSTLRTTTTMTTTKMTRGRRRGPDPAPSQKVDSDPDVLSSSSESSFSSSHSSDVGAERLEELPYPTRQPTPSATVLPTHQKKKTEDTSSVAAITTAAPGQKLHVILRVMEEEVQSLRRSYFELRQDLETIGRHSATEMAAGNRKGNSRSGPTSSSPPQEMTTTTTEAALEQRRQKRMIQEKLKRVEDSLKEKEEEIKHLQEQQERERRREMRSSQTVRSSATSRNDTLRQKDKEKHHDNGREKERIRHNHNNKSNDNDNDNNHDNKGDKDSDNNTTATSATENEDEQDEQEEQEERDQRSDGSFEYPVKEEDDPNPSDDTQGTARPRQGHRHHSMKESRRMDREKEKPQKETEGFRHRLANGFRVPKVQ
ncbi:hypothetical protein BGX28_000406 [Mortierella sp. GBA30]|nr:hypothetical protein BGX28_000406 [Mortierella sp. GBA30]